MACATSRNEGRRASAGQCLGAGLLLALVLVLDVLAASPAAHAWLHAHEPVAHACGHRHDSAGGPAPEGAEQGCVVFHFAAGHALGEPPAVLPRPAASTPAWDVLPANARFLAARFLQPPSCGPPVGRLSGT